MSDQSGDTPPKPTGLWRKLVFFPLVIAGAAIVVVMARSGGAPERSPPVERAQPVRVMSVQSVDLVPRAIGYGNVQPGRSWEVIAEVGGRIVEKLPNLESGELIPAGVVILRIDPTDFQLAAESTEARIRGAEAELAELEVSEANSQRALEIETRALELAEQDLKRQQTLLKRGTIAQATVDAVEQQVLTRRQAVQGQRSALALIPANRVALEATMARYQVDLAQARRDLERTEIATPFGGRVADVNVEDGQFVAAGQVLATIDGVDLAEVAAQFPINRIRPLLDPKSVAAIDLTPDTIGSVFEGLRLGAVVRLRAGDFVVEWEARFTRIREAVDPRTRTIGVVVAVENSYRQARPGERPPLTKNMYVEVELRGPVQPDKVVVPRSALHDGMIYVLGPEDRLERRPVRVGFRQSEFAVISEGLEAGERIVVGDLVPAVEGMLLAPVDDAELGQHIASLASGGGTVR